MARRFAVAGATYHRKELEIALANADARRGLPPIGPEVHRILDVGCGAGQTLIASRLGRDVIAVGMDPDLEALHMGTRLDRRIRFVCALGERLPFRSGTFDMVISRVALPYMKIRTALREMSRVLRPGGRIWFLLHPFKMVAREMVQYLGRLNLKPVVHRLYVMANGVLMNAFGIEVRSPFNRRYESFQTTRAMLREMQRAGFRDVRVHAGSRFEMQAVKAGTS